MRKSYRQPEKKVALSTRENYKNERRHFVESNRIREVDEQNFNVLKEKENQPQIL